MAQIAVLAVSITAQTDKFVKGVDAALSKIESFTISTTKYAAAAGAAAAAGMAYFTKGAMDQIERTANLSDEIGIATENLAGLQHAAKLAGVEQDTLTGALEKFTRELAPGKDVFEAMLEEADKIKNLGNPVLQAAEAYEVFGKSGQKLIPMLLEGSAGLRGQIADAEALGLAFSAIDAERVRQANDAFDRMKALVDGIFIQLAPAIAPIMEAAAVSIVNFGMEAVTWTKEATGGFEGLVSLVEKFGNALDGAAGVWHAFVAGVNKQAANALYGIRTSIQAAGNFVGAGAFEIDTSGMFGNWEATLSQNMVDEKRRMQRALEGGIGGGGTGARWRTEIEEISRRADEAARKYADMADERRRLAAETVTDFSESFKGDTFVDHEAFARANEELDKMREKMESVGEAMRKELLTPAEKFEEAQAEALKLLEAQAITQETFDRKIASLMEEYQVGTSADVAERIKGGFRSLDLSNVSIQGLKGDQDREQKVKAPVMEGLLREIKDNTKGVGKAQ